MHVLVYVARVHWDAFVASRSTALQHGDFSQECCYQTRPKRKELFVCFLGGVGVTSTANCNIIFVKKIVLKHARNELKCD